MTTEREQEIRNRFREGWGHASVALADALTEADVAVDELFDIDDFRDSEVAELDAMFNGARALVLGEYDAVMARYRDALEDVAVRFAAEHPDAPLATREAVPA